MFVWGRCRNESGRGRMYGVSCGSIQLSAHNVFASTYEQSLCRLMWTTSIVMGAMQWAQSRLMQPHRGPGAAAQGCFNPSWLHNAGFREARPCCDSLQRYTQSALYK